MQWGRLDFFHYSFMLCSFVSRETFFVNYFLFCTDFFQTKNLENARIVAVNINCGKIFRLCSVVSRETFFRFSLFPLVLFCCPSHSFLDATVASVLKFTKYIFIAKGGAYHVRNVHGRRMSVQTNKQELIFGNYRTPRAACFVRTKFVF